MKVYNILPLQETPILTDKREKQVRVCVQEK